MNFSLIRNWLKDRGFTVNNSNIFYPEYYFCERNEINLIVKEYDQKNLKKEIRSDSVDLRRKLNELGINVWNSYLIICSKDLQENLTYTIEKDAVGIRKYVINSIEDFKRIPFLDEKHSNEDSGMDVFFSLENTEEKEFGELIDLIIENEGLQKTLKDDEIMSILSKLYRMRGLEE